MIDIVHVAPGRGLEDYASYAHMAGLVADLRAEGANLVPALRGKTVWMVNSTAQGGGVAEMLPAMVSLLRELGVSIEWATIGTERTEFFALTKKIHNLIHGSGEPSFTDDERALYETVSRELADEMEKKLSPGDILVVHDPQPAGMGHLLRERLDIHAVWRCHIGLDEDLPQTRAAWELLEPHVCAYDHAVFSAPEYIPPFLSTNVSIVAPALDPLSDKNRPLSVHQLVGILCHSGLMVQHEPLVRPHFAHKAERLRPDGTFGPATEPDDIGVLYRPVVTQVSRWDRLKGWAPLLDAFAILKENRERIPNLDDIQRRRLDLVRLILAGPDPASIQDDPEGREVLDELRARYAALDPDTQKDVALISLPMVSRRENALMVNVLQRCSTVVVQNSLQEGFGLTAAEAMWKQTAILGSRACGLRQQIRDDLDGRLHPNAEDPKEIADVMVEMLCDAPARESWSRRAQRRVHDEFLIFTQLRKWLYVLTRTIGHPHARGSRPSIPAA